MSNKFLVLLFILLLAATIGSIYGILHDEITYTISPEYYTKFKFQQFGLDGLLKSGFPAPARLLVALVGILATWWMGLFIGLVLGLVGLIHPTTRIMFRTTLRAFLITILIAFVFGLIGLAYGHFIAHLPLIKLSDLNIPDDVENVISFIVVACMHNFSYLGGMLGMIAGVIYSMSVYYKAEKSATIMP